MYFFIMNISHKRELEQIVHNHSSDIDSKVFMDLYKKVYCNFLVTDVTTLASDNP